MMHEINGNIWDYYKKPNVMIGITTNGVVDVEHRLIMGAGVAGEAKNRISDIDLQFGKLVELVGNYVMYLELYGVFSFPTKNHFSDPSPIDLIIRSSDTLAGYALVHPGVDHIIPRPGCGYGGLNWERDVKPAIKPLFEGLNNIFIIDF